MTDEVLRELAGQLHGVLTQVQVEPGKHPWTECSYTAPGPHPFVCQNCRYYTPASPHTGYCQIVEGPYDGEVGPNDACRWWEAAPALLHQGVPTVDTSDGGSTAGPVDGGE